MPDRSDLEASWARTTAHMNRAAALLPLNAIQPAAGTDAPDWREFLDHNELELALDDLEVLGDLNGMHEEFWAYLRMAAAEMKLEDRVARYETRG